MTTFKDNYPANIESPQKVYYQYSADIDFDYSTGKYPTGNESSFLWEEYFIPIEHNVNGVIIGPHVWNRFKIGASGIWSSPNKVGGPSIADAAITKVEDNDDEYTFTIVGGDGSIQEITFLVPPGRDGIDGEDGEDGIDGIGLASFIVNGPELIWLDPVLAHNPSYMHIRTNGINNQGLTSNGDGTFRWENYLLSSLLNDSAGIGDTGEMYSADKILSLIGTIDSYGIKYVVNLITDLPSIVGMTAEDLAIVDNDPTATNRPVYKWDGATWNFFFDMDAIHEHDSRYYTQVQLDGGQLDTRYYTETEVDVLLSNYYNQLELQTSGGSSVHWDNLTAVPNLLEDSDISAVSPISYSVGTGVITHDNASGVSLSPTSLEYVSGIGIDASGHIQTIDTTNITTEVIPLEKTDGSIIIEGFGGIWSNVSEYNPFDPVATQFRFKVGYRGIGGDYGNTEEAARADHSHSGLVTYATYLEVVAGTESAKVIAPSTLKGLVNRGHFNNSVHVDNLLKSGIYGTTEEDDTAIQGLPNYIGVYEGPSSLQVEARQDSSPAGTFQRVWSGNDPIPYVRYSNTIGSWTPWVGGSDYLKQHEDWVTVNANYSGCSGSIQFRKLTNGLIEAKGFITVPSNSSSNTFQPFSTGTIPSKYLPESPGDIDFTTFYVNSGHDLIPCSFFIYSNGYNQIDLPISIVNTPAYSTGISVKAIYSLD